MIVCAASGFYYYFKVIRSMYWDKPAENAEPVQVPAISGVMLGRVFHLHRAGGPDAPVPEPHPVTNASFSPILPKAVSPNFFAERPSPFKQSCMFRVVWLKAGRGRRECGCPAFRTYGFSRFRILSNQPEPSISFITFMPEKF